VFDPLDIFGQWSFLFDGKSRDYVVHHNLEERRRITHSTYPSSEISCKT
jgi:hypothetical protein